LYVASYCWYDRSLIKYLQRRIDSLTLSTACRNTGYCGPL